MSRCQPPAHIGDMRRGDRARHLLRPGARSGRTIPRRVVYLDPWKRYATALEIESLHGQAAITKVVTS